MKADFNEEIASMKLVIYFPRLLQGTEVIDQGTQSGFMLDSVYLQLAISGYITNLSLKLCVTINYRLYFHPEKHDI